MKSFLTGLLMIALSLAGFFGLPFLAIQFVKWAWNS